MYNYTIGFPIVEKYMDHHGIPICVMSISDLMHEAKMGEPIQQFVCALELRAKMGEPIQQFVCALELRAINMGVLVGEEGCVGESKKLPKALVAS